MLQNSKKNINVYKALSALEASIKFKQIISCIPKKVFNTNTIPKYLKCSNPTGFYYKKAHQVPL